MRHLFVEKWKIAKYQRSCNFPAKHCTYSKIRYICQGILIKVKN